MERFNGPTLSTNFTFTFVISAYILSFSSFQKSFGCNGLETENSAEIEKVPF